MQSQLSQILNAGFETLSQLQSGVAVGNETPTKRYLYFNGERFPLVIDEERFTNGDDLGEAGIDLTFQHNQRNVRLPMDNDRVRIGINETEAIAYITSSATYAQGSPLGRLTVSNNTG